MPSQPKFRKGDESSPKSVVKNPDQAVRMSAQLQSGIGPVDPGDVLGQQSDGPYAQTVKAVLQEDVSNTDSTASVDEVDLLSSGDNVILARGETDEESGILSSVDADNNTVTISGTFSSAHTSGTSIRRDDGSHVAKAIYPGQRTLSYERLKKGNVNDGLVVGNALVDSADLNHYDANAREDLDDDFIFDN